MDTQKSDTDGVDPGGESDPQSLGGPASGGPASDGPASDGPAPRGPASGDAASSHAGGRQGSDLEGHDPEGCDPEGWDPEGWDPAGIDSLVFQCLELLEDDGAGAVESLLSGHPERADAVRARLASLAQVGLLEPEAPRVSEERLPRRLGEFRILGRLGEGGMGVVVRAVQESLGRRVALKLVRPSELLFPGARERFRREVEAVGRLSHASIVAVHAVGEEEGLPYLAMEEVPGISLAELLGVLGRECEAGKVRPEQVSAVIRRAVRERAEPAFDPVDLSVNVIGDGPSAKGPAPKPSSRSDSGAKSYTELCLRIVLQVARGLEHAHAQGILHRDIKPSNILVCEGGRALLCDFGLAQVEGANELTRSGARPGSLPYMPPERLSGSGAADECGDVYALGITLAEALALQPAFGASDPELLMREILEGRVRPLREANPSIPRDVELIVRTACELDPRLRYPSAAALARDLENALALRPLEARPLPRSLRFRRWLQRHPTLTAAIAVLAVLSGIGSFAFSLQGKRADERLQEEEARVERADLENEAHVERALGTSELLSRVAAQGVGDGEASRELHEQAIQSKIELDAFLRDRERLSREMELRVLGAYAASSDLHMDLGDLETAIEICEHYLTRVDSALARDGGAATEDDELEKLKVRARLASALMLDEQFSAAETETRRVIEDALEWKQNSPGRSDIERVLAHSWVKLGNILMKAGRGDEVDEALGKGIAGFDALAIRRPLNYEERTTLAWGLDLQGQSWIHAGELERATEALERAVHEAEAAEDLGAGSMVWASQAATSYGNLAKLLGARNRVEEARRYRERGIELNRRLMVRFPRTPGHRDRLASLLMNEAVDAASDGRPEHAEANLEEALEIRRELCTRWPSLAGFRGRLGMLLLNQGTLRFTRGDLDGAIEHFEEALQEILEARRSALQDPEYLAAEGILRINLAMAHDRHANHRAVAAILEDLPRDAGPESSWNAARYHSRAAIDALNDIELGDDERYDLIDSYLESAVIWLEWCEEIGRFDADDFRADQGFIMLFDDDRALDIVARAESNVADD